MSWNDRIGYVRQTVKCWHCQQELGAVNGYDPREGTKSLEAQHFPWKCKSDHALQERERIFKETDDSVLTCDTPKPHKPMTIEEFDQACLKGAQVLEARNRAKFEAMTDLQKDTLKQLSKKKPPKWP